MQDELISVIIPVYNVAPYLEQCVNSVRQQTYSNLEIILVDDGSTDGSGAICDAWAKRDARIYVFHKKNGGLSDARNFGLERATGTYIGFVDSDDFIHPQMYEMLIDAMKEKDAQVAACDFARENEEDFRKPVDVSRISHQVLGGEEALANLNLPLSTVCNKLFSKELFAGVRFPKGRAHEDEAVIHRLLAPCKRIVKVSCPLYFYLVREDSIMHSVSEKRVEDLFFALQDRIAYEKEQGLCDALTAAVNQYCWNCAEVAYRVYTREYDFKQLTVETLYRMESETVQDCGELPIRNSYRKMAKTYQEFEMVLKRKVWAEGSRLVRAKRRIGNLLRARGLRR